MITRVYIQKRAGEFVSPNSFAAWRGFHAGNPLVFPDPAVVQSAVQCWGTDAPAGYGMDFGVVVGGATCLVEVNDGFSLGCLGLRPGVYTQILEARWTQLTAPTTTTVAP
jgi:hypothetical protein